MSLDYLGLFGDFGLKRKPRPTDGRFNVQGLPCLTFTAETAAAFAQSLRRREIYYADFVAPCDVVGLELVGELSRIGDVPDSPSKHLLRLDSWAWATDSLFELAAFRVSTVRSDASALSLNERSGDTAAQAFVVSSDLLIALSDPRVLLRAMKIAAFKGEKVLVAHGSESGVAADAFFDWLAAYGFTVVREDLQGGLAVFSCTCTRDAYSAYLSRCGMDAAMLDVAKLLITTEDADVHNTGGIGTYIKNIRAINPTIGTLLCHLEASQSAMPARTVCPKPFVGEMAAEPFFEGLGLVESVHALLCLLPSISAIEFQDYRSIGFRLVQAKTTGQLPQWLHISVILHGSVDYVKHGVGDDSAVNYGIHELKYAVKDAFIFEHVDECVAPSRYLAEKLLREEFGYSLNNLRYVRLPFDLTKIPSTPAKAFVKPRRLVYVGKYNRLKGWQDFIQAVVMLAAKNALTDISEIVSLAPTAPSREDRSKLAAIKPYRALHLSHAEMLAFLNEHRHDALIVFPSRGENYPFVVLEQLLLGTRFVAYDAGGAPEVVNDTHFVTQFFSLPNATALASRIEQAFDTPVEDYAGVLDRSRTRAIERQKTINAEWSRPIVPSFKVGNGYARSSVFGAADANGAGSDAMPDIRVAIAIPVYNTALSFLSNLFDSIRSSKLQPTRVLLVNDGSAPSYATELEALAHERFGNDIAWQLHTQENKGLAGARNAALHLLDEPFIFFIDSDDCLLTHTLQDALVAMLLDDQCVAATGFAVYARGEGRPSLGTASLRKADFWMPLGTDKARALSLFENQYLTANAIVRGKAYREIGGWDESDRSMWEDWALYSRLAWQGKRFSLIPAAGYLYRSSADSMSKTYSRYGGRRRLVRNLPFATRVDANVIYSLVNGAGSERSLLSGPALSEREAELISFIRTLLNKPRLRGWILKMYGAYSSLRRKI